MKLTSAGLLAMIVFYCACNQPAMVTVEEVKLNRFSGQWFEVASYPTSFNKNCNCSKFDYKLSENGTYFKMIFSCMKKNKQGAVLAKAYVVKGSGNAKLRVQHFWPFRSDYYVIALDSNYQYAMLGGPGKDLLIILSRSEQLDELIYTNLVAYAHDLGFNTEALLKTPQTCQ